MKRHSLPGTILAFGSAFVLMIGGVAVARDYNAQSGQNGAVSWNQVSITADVVDVIPSEGLISLRDPNGSVHTLKVDEQVDLMNIEQGDRVNVTVYQASVAQIEQPTDADRSQPFQVIEEVRPPSGVNPAMGAVRQIRALMTITDVNQGAGAITAEGPAGRSYVFSVADPSLLEKAERGKEFTIVFTEGIAAKVQKI